MERKAVEPDRTESMVKAVGEREYLVQLSSNQRLTLMQWLEFPNGSLSLGRRFLVNAVEGGGILVLVKPFSYEAGDR